MGSGNYSPNASRTPDGKHNTKNISRKLTLNCQREWILILVLLFPMKSNRAKVFFSNTLVMWRVCLKQIPLNMVFFMVFFSLFSFPCVFFGGKAERSEDTVTEKILLLHVAGRVKITTPRTSNYFSTKNTLLVAMWRIISHWKIPHCFNWEVTSGLLEFFQI